MKKLLKILGATVAIVIIAIICLVLFWLGPTVKKTAETIGPKAIGAPLTIEKLSIFPLRGTVQLRGLFVGNPEGFSTESAVELQQFKVDVSIGSLLTDTIIVREILIEKPVFTYERKLKTDNIAAIQNNIAAFTAKEEEAAPAEEPTEEKKPSDKPSKKVIIERLVVKDGLVKAKISALPTAPIPIPDIEKTDIGKKEGGASWSDAIREIISTLYEAITGVVGNIGEAATDAVKDAGGALKDAGDATLETATDTIKNIGGLFKKEE